MFRMYGHLTSILEIRKKIGKSFPGCLQTILLKQSKAVERPLFSARFTQTKKGILFFSPLAAS